MKNSFDAIIIGAGQAGPALAGKLTSSGMKVALIERNLFGGTCVNTGCTPTKALIASAYAAHTARRGADFGFETHGPIRIDMRKIKVRADAIAAGSRTSVEKYLREMPGCTVIKAHAKFEGPHEIRANGELLTAPRIFINVGARASVPRLPGVGEVPFLTNGTMLALDQVPEHLVVIGGSYVGLEFAQMHRRFGAKVTIIEKSPHLISREDDEISEAIRGILEREGITIRTGAECINLSPHEKGVKVGVQCPTGDPYAIGSHVLLAVGRTPNTNDLGLDKATIQIDSRGYILVNEELETSIKGVFALGDCNGRGAFTHTAYNDFEIVADNLLKGKDRHVGQRIPAYGLYTDPPLGRVGMSEREARHLGKPLLIGSRPMNRVNRAIEKGETQGLMKIVVDAQSRQILGAAILGVGGDEAIHGILQVMNAHLPYDAITRAMPIHPTVSELIPTMLGELRSVG